MSLNLFNYRGIFWIHIYTYNSSQRDKVCKTYNYMYIHFISSTNNGDDVTRQYNYISFQEADEIDNLKYTTINMHKICVLHVIIYYMYYSETIKHRTRCITYWYKYIFSLDTSALEIISKKQYQSTGLEKARPDLKHQKKNI